MKKIIFVLLAIFPLLVFSQKKKLSSFKKSERKSIIHTSSDPEKLEIEKFQKDLNKEYLNPKESPLRGDNFKNFKAHPFFPIDLKYRVIADFVKNENPEPFD